MGCFQPLNGTLDAFLMPQQLGIDAITPDKTDDVGNDLRAAHAVQSGIELPDGKAFTPQGKAQTLESLAGQVCRTGTDDIEGRHFVTVVLHKGGKGLQIVLRGQIALAVAACVGEVRTSSLVSMTIPLRPT